MQSMFLGGMILDMSTKTNKAEAASLINLLMTPFDHFIVRDVASEEQKSPAFETRKVVEGDLVSGFTFFGTSTPVSTISLQNKNSQVISYCAGDIDNAAELDDYFRSSQHFRPSANNSEMIGNMLLRVNAQNHIADASGEPAEFQNYTHRVKSRLTDVIEGAWSGFSVFSSTQRSTIVLASRNRSLRFTVVVLSSCLILIWSSEMDAVTQLLDAIRPEDDEARLKKAWVANISVLQDKTTMVIHPVYLLSKVRFFGQSVNFDPIRLTSKIEKYLQSGAY